MQRREFLKRGLESAVLLYCAVELPPLYAANRAQAEPTHKPLTSLAALPAFVDTLIPADATPSASQLGLDQALTEHAQAIENYPQLLQLGCDWLTETATRLHNRPFQNLKPTEQEAVVTLAEASPSDTIARKFFDRVRFDLFGLYYATASSWDGLGINSPPQPVGYLDYRQPPKKTTRG